MYRYLNYLRTTWVRPHYSSSFNFKPSFSGNADSGTGVTFVSKRPNHFIPSAGLFNPVLVGPSRNLCLKGAYFLVLLVIPTLLDIRLIINELLLFPLDFYCISCVNPIRLNIAEPGRLY